jgi:hypothetical protein
MLGVQRIGAVMNRDQSSVSYALQMTRNQADTSQKSKADLEAVEKEFSAGECKDLSWRIPASHVPSGRTRPGV